MAVSAVLLQQVECPVSLSRYEEWWLLPGISHHNGRNVVCSRPRTPPHVLIDTATSHQDNVLHSHSGPPSSTCHTKTKTQNLVIKCGFIVWNENECWYWVVLVLVLCPAIEAINQRVFRKQLSITADQLARVVCGIVCWCSLQLSAN